MEPRPLDRMWARGRTSVRARLARLQSKSWQIGQCALAAGAAWFIASDVLGHQTPFFAPIAAVVSLGTSYGQRLRRVVEVTLGVAMGVLLADLIVAQVGSGWWQLTVLVALAMSAAFLLDGGQLFVTQAAVQSIVVSTLLPDPSQGLIRWTDALIGGAVALVAATVVPSAPLRRPREQAAVVMRKIATLLRASGEVMVDGEVDRSLDLLADARATDYLIRELQDAAAEGLSVVASSPFRIRHKGNLRRMVELVDPLDRALRSTRVLVRQTAVAAYHRREVPRVVRPARLRPGGRRRPGGRGAGRRRDGHRCPAGTPGRRQRHRPGRAHRAAHRGGRARAAALGGGRPVDAHRS